MPNDQPDQEPAEPSETQRLNVLLEEIHSQMSVIAEDHRGFRSELGSMALALKDVDERLGVMEPIVKTLGPVPKKLDDLERKLDTFNQRLAAAESK